MVRCNRGNNALLWPVGQFPVTRLYVLVKAVSICNPVKYVCYHPQPMRLRVLIVFSCFLILGTTSSAQVRSEPDANILSACAAFAPNGTSAFAEVETKGIFLEITSADGKVSHLNLPLRYPPPASQPTNRTINRRVWTCAIYFNHQSDLVSLGISSKFGQPEVTHLQMGVAELNTPKWIGDFGVKPQLDFLPLSLAGFLEDTNSLIIAGKINSRGGVEKEGLPASVQLSALGEQLSSTPSVRRPEEITDTFHSYADAGHNRLWLFPCSSTRVHPYHVPLCPVSVTSLVGEDLFSATLDPASYGGKRDTLWMWPGAFAAPDSSTIVIAETVSGKDTVWRVDMQKKSIDHFVLPHNHFVKYNGLHDAALSPDGEVLAVLLDRIELGFPYFVDNYDFKGTDVVVMQLRPFRLLGVIPHKDSSYTAALAVDHRKSKAIVLVYTKGHLVRQEFRAP